MCVLAWFSSYGSCNSNMSIILRSSVSCCFAAASIIDKQ